MQEDENAVESDEAAPRRGATENVLLAPPPPPIALTLFFSDHLCLSLSRPFRFLLGRSISFEARKTLSTKQKAGYHCALGHRYNTRCPRWAHLGFPPSPARCLSLVRDRQTISTISLFLFFLFFFFLVFFFLVFFSPLRLFLLLGSDPMAVR